MALMSCCSSWVGGRTTDKTSTSALSLWESRSAVCRADAPKHSNVGVGAGIHQDVAEACGRAVQVVQRTAPVGANADLYNQFYPVYRALYNALKPSFDQVSELVAQGG